MEEQKNMQRGEPEDTPEARKALVSQICEDVKADLKHWDYAFKRMNAWRQFARGLQWPGSTAASLSDPERRYVANITMRQLKTRTASIYAKNPKYQWRRSKRLNTLHWDGTAAQLMLAQQAVAQGMDMTGQYSAIIQEALTYQAESKMLGRVGETATALYEYFIREQTPPAKKMMKKQVLAALTCGVAYFKQTFQRQTDTDPNISRALEDHRSQLAMLEQLSKDLADDEFDENDARMEQLRVLIASLEQQEMIILREGLALDYPDSTNIIPDQNMTDIIGFIGCSRVTEQYCLTRDQIKRVYGIDLGEGYTKYSTDGTDQIGGTGDDQKRETARVWEVWDKEQGVIYTVCDGYHDYLVEPHAPITYTERFWPWFVYAPNAIDYPEDPFPPSDVELITPMQMEVNRAGQALREHRKAARPGWVTGANVPDEDRMRMENRKAHDVVVLKSLKPEEDIRAKFQPFPTAGIDPNLYNTGPAFQDILRAVGSQEANLGGTSGATATESSIAESSRQSGIGSAIDEFDDLLTEMARAGGQILMQEMDEATVKEICGPAAMWPAASSEDIAKEIYLEVVAGSSGRPNQAQEVQIRERIYPLLMQIPGLSPEQMGKDLLRVMDDGVHYEDWIDLNSLSIIAMNGMTQAAANRGADGSGETGGAASEGSNNAEAPPEPSSAGPARPGQPGMGAVM